MSFIALQGSGTSNFRLTSDKVTDSCKFPKEKIMSAHNFNFTPNFPKVTSFVQLQFLHYGTQILDKKIFRQPKI